MSDERQVETERRFGTGLRAQLAKRQEPAENAEAPPPEPPPTSPLRAVEVEVRAADGATFAELESLRLELSSSLTRERELRTTLESRLAADSHQGPATVSAELEQRAAALAEHKLELAAQATALAKEQRRLAEAKAEVAADESRVADRERQITSKFREL